MNKSIAVMLTLVPVMYLSACATIVGQSTHAMPVASSPEGAIIEITDEKGVEVFKGETPTTVTLEKSDGSYWGGKKYTVRLTKDGFAPQTVDVKAAPNGWYVAGNFVFGGLIGWFIVDPLGGKMYSLAPKEINATLGESTARPGTPALKFVLLQDLPAGLRSRITEID
jgi:hypothetical protein